MPVLKTPLVASSGTNWLSGPAALYDDANYARAQSAVSTSSIGTSTLALVGLQHKIGSSDECIKLKFSVLRLIEGRNASSIKVAFTKDGTTPIGTWFEVLLGSQGFAVQPIGPELTTGLPTAAEINSPTFGVLFQCVQPDPLVAGPSVEYAEVEIHSVGGVLDTPVLGGKANESSHTLTWQAIAGATTYAVQSATSSGGPWTTVLPSVTELSATFVGTVLLATTFYRVKAIRGSIESPFSNVVSLTSDTPLAAPGSVRASEVVSFTDATIRGRVKVQWDAVPSAVSYTVQRAREAGGVPIIVGSGITATEFTDATVNATGAWYYRVRAVGANVDGVVSEFVSAWVSQAYGNPPKKEIERL